MKKSLSVLIVLAMLLGAFALFTVSTAATGVDLPANTIIYDPAATDAVTEVEWQGTVYNVTFGTNYFNDFGIGRNAITEGGTVLLVPGNYPAFAPTKSMTIKGAKAGINPNVKGANKLDDWTMNPERSTNAATESVLTGAVYLTTGGDAVLGSPINLTLDGVVINNGYFRSTNFAECEQNLTLKNVVVASANSVSLLYSSNAGGNAKNLATNLCKRSITIENMRVLSKGNVSTSLFPELTADSFNATGVYMASAATCSLIESIYTSSNNDNLNPTYTVRDSMFRQPARAFNLSFRNATRSDLLTAQATKTSITVTIDSCVFKDVRYNGKAIQPQPNNANTRFYITNNVFYESELDANYYPIADYANSTFDYTIVLDNNEFYNVKATANINYTTQKAPITRSLFYKDGVVTSPVIYNRLSIDSYFIDLEKTTLRFKDNGCVTFKGVQTSAIAEEKTNIRFIVAVDDIDYIKAGMVLTAKVGDEGEEKVVDRRVYTVYTSIIASGELGIAEYTAGDLGGKYLMAISIQNVPANAEKLIFTVKPYAQMSDGINVDSTKYQVIMRNGTVVPEDITVAG